jgi:outer membrane protein assembly factor BamB
MEAGSALRWTAIVIWSVAGLTGSGVAEESALPANAGLPAPRVERPTGVYERLDLRLKGAAEGRDVLVFMGLRDGQPTDQVWAMTAGSLAPHDMDGDGFAVTNGRLTGRLLGWGPPYEVELEVVVGGGAVSGTYRGKLRDQPVRKHPAWSKGKQDIKGEVTGERVSGKELVAANGLAKGKDWPCLRGPYGNGSAADRGQSMVESPNQVRAVWCSEGFMPTGYGRPGGGYNGPTVADGLVYVHYWYGDGAEVHSNVWEEAGGRAGLAALLPPGRNQDRWKRYLSVGADEYVTCHDGATGRLIWKAVFPGHAVNAVVRTRGFKFAKFDHQATQCVYGGRVYAVGQADILYCLDAKTGEPAWIHYPNGIAERLERARQENRVGRLSGVRAVDPSAVSPNVIGGVLIANGAGYDARTGKSLWPANNNLIGKGEVPIRWTCAGKEYALRGPFCVDPLTGKTVWTAPGVHDGEPGSLAISGDTLVLHGSRKGGKLFQGFRMSATGAEKLWETSFGDDANRQMAVKRWSLQGFKSSVIYRDHVYGWVQNGGGEADGAYFGLLVDIRTGKIVASSGGQSGYAKADGKGDPYRTGACGAFVQTDGLVIYEGMRLDRIVPPDLAPMLPSRGHFPAWSTTPAIADGRVFWRWWHGLACYDLRKPPPGAVASDPVLPSDSAGAEDL